MEARKEFVASDIDALLENVRVRINQRRDKATFIDVVEDEDELVLRFRSPQTQEERYTKFQDLAGRGTRIADSVFDDMLAYAHRDDEDDREDSRIE